MLNINDHDLIKSASYASVSVALIIMVIKTYGWITTGSQSILASLIDAILDISSSLINLIAVRIALLPPDDNHRFGHDKFQDLAIFSQSIFFFASCLFILFASIKSLFLGASLANYEIGTTVMYWSLILTVILVGYQSYVVKKTKSKIIAVDKLHYFMDFVTNSIVIVSLYLSATYWYIDAVAGIAIAMYIIYASYQLFRDAIKNLADEEFAPTDRNKIVNIIREFPEIKGLHDLKTRYAGHKPFIQLHLEMNGNMSLYAAHEISDRVILALLEEFPHAEIIIHQDPAGVEENINYREQI
jgi:cation diffusion facilitator family transporter